MPKTAQIIDLRWMVQADLSQVMDIEFDCFEFPWTESDFRKLLSRKSVFGFVATPQNQREAIVGYMLYEVCEKRLFLFNLAVRTDSWRRGIGRQMAQKLIDKLSPYRRRMIECETSERNVRAQLFLRSMGFSQAGVLNNWYSGTDEDCYQFRYLIQQDA